MFLRSIEITLIVLLLVVSWRIVRHSFAANLLRLMMRLICLAAGVAGGIAAFGPLADLASNFVLQFLLAYAVGAVVFVATGFCLGWRAQRGNWNQWIETKLQLPRWFDRALIVSMLLIIWFVVLVGADLTGRLISIHPSSRAAADQTIVMRHLVELGDSQSAPADDAEYSPEQRRVLETMAMQADFFGRFKSGVRQSSDKLLEVTGTEALLRQFNAVQEILKLPDAEKRWLIRQNPQLMQLVGHPAIRRISKNDALLAQFERVAEGSIEAVYLIGDDEDIRALLEDPEVRRIISEVDPAQFLEQLQTYRKTRGRKSTETSAGDR